MYIRNSSEAPEGPGLLEGVLHYSLALGERLPKFGEIRAVTEGARKPRTLPRPMTAPIRISRRILILESGIWSVALAGAEREVPSVDGAPSELRSTELGSIGTQHAI
ncbi:hypothetical protein BpHYR1_005625 [Brachionus plicatilis]|uniref:Uncharacterized protein n=1 Tax=Brachionus plicatilis TaxID=10195 RepID=A0A3M7T8P3_BRAPC|nr:hypothetical protein BpHYR1_005625 [Brachionus plicatilis]